MQSDIIIILIIFREAVRNKTVLPNLNLFELEIRSLINQFVLDLLDNHLEITDKFKCPVRNQLLNYLFIGETKYEIIDAFHCLHNQLSES